VSLTPKEQAIRLLIIRVLRDLLKDADNAEREQVCREWSIGDRIGAALGPGGEVAGHVLYKRGAVKAEISDPGAFHRWVEKNRPEEIETITRVRPAFAKAVLTRAQRLGTPVTEDGEEIPGVSVLAKDPQVTVIPTEDAEELVRQAWQSGQLQAIVADLLRPALEAPRSGEDAA